MLVVGFQDVLEEIYIRHLHEEFDVIVLVEVIQTGRGNLKMEIASAPVRHLVRALHE